MTDRPIHRKDFDTLLAYLGVFRASGYQCTSESDDWYPAYRPEVSEFFTTLQNEPWVDYEYDPNAVGERLTKAAIQDADIDELRSILTFMARSERFCDGAWAGHFEDGLLIEALERLKALRELI
ncbi:MAG: DUF6508 domain-containing protein [Sedimenticola sp.]